MIQSEYLYVRTYNRPTHNRRKKRRKGTEPETGTERETPGKSKPLSLCQEYWYYEAERFPFHQNSNGNEEYSHTDCFFSIQFNLVVPMQFYPVLNSPPFPALCPLALHKCRAIYVCPAPSLPLSSHASLQFNPSFYSYQQQQTHGKGNK